MSANPRSAGSPGSNRLVYSLRLAVPLLLLVALVSHLGTSPFERSLHVISPGPVAVALLLGALTTVAQAMRWRTVAAGYAAASGLTRGRAVRECYRSSLLNAVLPVGVLGDAVRAWRQRPARERGLRSSAQAVIGERVAGTVILAIAVSIVTIPVDLRVSGIALGGAVVAALIAAPTMKRLTWRGQLAVWGWSVLALGSLVAKFAVAAAVLGTVPGPKEAVALALIVLAGMSVPIGIGGFGPREAVAAIAFGSVGLSAQSGVATSAAYGVLAAISALPGVLVMLFDLRHESKAAAGISVAQLNGVQLSGVQLSGVQQDAAGLDVAVPRAEQLDAGVVGLTSARVFSGVWLMKGVRKANGVRRAKGGLVLSRDAGREPARRRIDLEADVLAELEAQVFADLEAEVLVDQQPARHGA